jgi:hypothetical protein
MANETATRPGLIVFSLRTWPKAQYLARALGIPTNAWDIPFLFAQLGGPELSVFEAMERPNLGGLTARLKALTKPLAAAAYTDPWVSSEVLGGGQVAVAFHPGVDSAQVREMSARDGYRVVDVADALTARRAELDETLANEGLLDGHAALRSRWLNDGMGDVLERTVALPVWDRRHHSAAFYLASRPEDWPRLARIDGAGDAMRALRDLVAVDIAHPVLTGRLDVFEGHESIAG